MPQALFEVPDRLKAVINHSEPGAAAVVDGSDVVGNLRPPGAVAVESSVALFLVQPTRAAGVVETYLQVSPNIRRSAIGQIQPAADAQGSIVVDEQLLGSWPGDEGQDRAAAVVDTPTILGGVPADCCRWVGAGQEDSAFYNPICVHCASSPLGRKTYFAHLSWNPGFPIGMKLCPHDGGECNFRAQAWWTVGAVLERPINRAGPPVEWDSLKFLSRA